MMWVEKTRRSLWRAAQAVGLGLGLVVLSACGGGGGGDAVNPPPEPVPEVKPTRAEAARFLTQATFGPTTAHMDAVVAQGYAAWLDAQLAKPASLSYVSYWDARNAALGGTTANPKAGQREVLDAFWTQAVSGDDQVRARVAFALSQIFVVSMLDSGVGNNSRGLASYADMLGAKGLGRYRDLLESVALHPVMGTYLTSLHNMKENTRTGRVPDENFAREVMQLFSIGLVQLNADGSVKTSGGSPVPTYTPSDISGLAKVFTGWSYACPVSDDSCFFSGVSRDAERDIDAMIKPMRSYPQFHSSSVKSFLGATVPDQGSNADPAASLKLALDTLAGHPNVGPFLARQMIQRMVTSNPSPAYVGRVASAFAAGNGDMKALVRAVLLDTEARSATGLTDASFGKLREPVLRLSAFLRAFDAKSDSGSWLVGTTDSNTDGLSQTPFRAPSVFNFYRPGYVPSGGQLGLAGLLAPEMQITHESSVVGYVNYMSMALQYGVGQNGYDYKAARRDVQPDFLRDTTHALRTLAATDADVPALVDQVATRLLPSPMPTALKDIIVPAVLSIAVPVANGKNQDQIESAKLNRVRTAVMLTLASPEYTVQK